MRVLRKKAPEYTHHALTKVVDRLIDDPENTVLVAELSSVPGEPLGFVAHCNGDLLMIFVLAEVNGVRSRRKGVGTALLDKALEGVSYAKVSYYTRPGRALIDHWKRHNSSRRIGEPTKPVVGWPEESAPMEAVS
jgi:hypothetical protein